MVKIKICGIRQYVDVLYLNKYKPDYAGFILTEGFGRSIDFNTFLTLCDTLNSEIKKVGVFVNENLDTVKMYSSLLDVVQLHGNENEEYIKQLRQYTKCEIWKAVRVSSYDDIENADKLSCDKLLLDSYVKGMAGGTGKTTDLSLIKQAQFSKEFILAGGLDKDNILDAIGKVSPFAVDFSSSVETDGVKDESKIKEIITTIRGGFTNE